MAVQETLNLLVPVRIWVGHPFNSSSGGVWLSSPGLEPGTPSAMLGVVGSNPTSETILIKEDAMTSLNAEHQEET